MSFNLMQLKSHLKRIQKQILMIQPEVLDLLGIKNDSQIISVWGTTYLPFIIYTTHDGESVS